MTINNIFLNFAKVAYFEMTPINGILNSNETSSLMCTFNPTSLGKYQLNSYLCLLNETYKIPLKLFGSSSTISEKKKMLRGCECTMDDFSIDRILLEDGS